MFLFGKLKSVDTIEQEWLQLKKDYQAYNEIECSKKLKDFLALKEKVESKPFLEKKKEIESLNFKGSPEEKMLKLFSKLEKNKKILDYYKLAGSDDLRRFTKLKEKGISEQFKELEHFVKAGEYSRELKNFNDRKKKDKDNKEKWEQTEAYKKDKEYNELKSSSDFLFYNGFLKSPLYKNYLNIDGSPMLTQYEDLKKEVRSAKFTERKEYLEDKERYKKTEDYHSLLKFSELKDDSQIKLYFKYSDTDKFKFFRNWTLTFEDNFNKKLDPNIWSGISLIAENGPGKNYSLKNQYQLFNGFNNFKSENEILTLETRQEKTEGLCWDEEFGFFSREYDYTSGLIHTLKSFKQEYGLFEIKLKASKIKNVISSVSLIDEDEEVCIKLISVESYKGFGGIIYAGNNNTSHKLGLNFKPNGYMIIGVEWSPEKIEWKVNDKVMGSITQNIPHVKMGLRIESEVLKPTSNLPHRLDIDWVRCFKKNS
ncbi:MAG: family 16 glycosylhydrolase [Prolixibacteraceae bacterium]|nr:family 16 glycosylhydrolase [Prolixibacteraceae bacterium]